jgi:hypothetical protein
MLKKNLQCFRFGLRVGVGLKMAATDSRYEAGRKDGRIQDLMAEYEKVCDSLQDVEIYFPLFVFENPQNFIQRKSNPLALSWFNQTE